MSSIKIFHEPGPCIRQLSNTDVQNQNILSVLVKRTYNFDETGQCLLADEQLPLTEEIALDEAQPELIEADTDLYAFKPACDVVVKGHAYPSSSLEANEGVFSSGIAINKHIKELQVFGNRKAYKNKHGQIHFTNPEPVEKIKLSYANAYGGYDEAAEIRNGNLIAQLSEMLGEEMSPTASLYAYPRNPVGKGYVVEDSEEAFENLALPNLENPSQLLSPQTLLTQKSDRWNMMPLPWSLDWQSYSCFPRTLHAGICPSFVGTSRDFEEVQKEWVNETHFPQTTVPEQTVPEQTINAEQLTPEFSLGASIGMSLEQLKPGTKIQLKALHPTIPILRITLPKDMPSIWVDGRSGKLKKTKPVIQTVVIEPDENRLSLVWRGSAPALRPYFDDELETMPLKVEWKNG